MLRDRLRSSQILQWQGGAGAQVGLHLAPPLLPRAGRAMAVHAQHLAHAFRAVATDDAAVGGSVFPDDGFGRCAPAAGVGVRDTTLLREFPHSDLIGCGYYHGHEFEFEFEPRKRARVAADGFAADQRVPLVPPLPQAAVTAQVPACAGDDDAGACRALTAVESTSGRMGVADVAGGTGGGLLSRLYGHGAEIDAVVRLESERMRTELQEARRRHARALLAVAARAASVRLRAAEAALERALRRNAEVEDRARQAAAECHAWMGVARSHEAVAAGLRATLDQLILQSTPCAAAFGEGEGEAEDAQSCCFEAADGNNNGNGYAAAAASSCKACGAGEACVLLLPCRHLCLCRTCDRDPAVDACPVCAAAKNASLEISLLMVRAETGLIGVVSYRFEIGWAQNDL